MRYGSDDVTQLGTGDFDQLSAREADRVAARAADELRASLHLITIDTGDPDVASPEASLRAAATWFLTRLPERTHGPARRSPWWRPSRTQPPAPPQVGDPWHPGWADVDPASLPWWCWFRNGSAIWGPLGPDVCIDIQVLTAYVAQLVLDAHEGAAVRRSSGSPSAVDYRQPMVHIGDGREFGLTSRYDVMARRALDPDDRHHADAADPGFFVQRHVGLLHPLPNADGGRVAPADGAGAFDIAAGGSDGEYLITVDDVTAHERSDALDALVDLLGAASGVTGAHREDRDVLAVTAPSLPGEAISDLVTTCWADLLDG